MPPVPDHPQVVLPGLLAAFFLSNIHRAALEQFAADVNLLLVQHQYGPLGPLSHLFGPFSVKIGRAHV